MSRGFQIAMVRRLLAKIESFIAQMTRWLWPPGTRLWLNHTSDSLHRRLLERRLLKYRSSIRAGHLRRIARQVSVVDLRRMRFPLRSALCEDCVRDFHLQSSIR